MNVRVAVASPARVGRAARVWRRARRNRLGVGALVVVGLVTLAAVLAPWAAPYDPDATDPQAAELVKLHYFGGLTIEQTAAVLGVSVRKAYTVWAYARAWLFRCLGGEAPPAT